MASKGVLERCSETAETSCTEQEEIARVAYGLWEQRGRQDGHDLEDWLQAEVIVKQRIETNGGCETGGHQRCGDGSRLR